MPAVYRYTVSKTIETTVTAETPMEAVEKAELQKTAPGDWETTDVTARKDF